MYALTGDVFLSLEFELRQPFTISDVLNRLYLLFNSSIVFPLPINRIERGVSTMVKLSVCKCAARWQGKYEPTMLIYTAYVHPLEATTNC